MDALPPSARDVLCSCFIFFFPHDAPAPDIFSLTPEEFLTRSTKGKIKYLVIKKTHIWKK